MVDPDRVRQLLGKLRELRGQLAELAALERAQYTGRDAIAGRYLVQISAQVCIDLANHVISSSGWRVPSEYADAFTVLEEENVVEPGLVQRLRSLARMRNLLVHVYGDVDDGLVHEYLEAGILDLDAFAQAVVNLLDREADG